MNKNQKYFMKIDDSNVINVIGKKNSLITAKKYNYKIVDFDSFFGFGQIYDRKFYKYIIKKYPNLNKNNQKKYANIIYDEILKYYNNNCSSR